MDAFTSLFYRSGESVQGADGGLQVSPTTPEVRPVHAQTPAQTSTPKPIEHKSTSFKKVDMTVKKPPDIKGDVTMDPVQMNRLVNQVYEQLERKMHQERRRIGL
jgi:hypothetical protein